MLKIYIILFVNCLLVNFGTTQQDIGDACKVARTGAQGTCKIINNCPAAIADIRNRRGFPAVCGYAGNLQIVCCANPITQTTPPPRQTSNRISAKKCDEYKEIVYDIVNALDLATGQRIQKKSLNCAFVSVPLIVGGTEAKAREFPHMALIGFGEPGDIKWACGGSLISERFVLTAGHCLNSREIGPAKYVKLGDLWLDTDADDAKPVEIEIAERIPYPQYTTATQYFDIALLRLANDVQFNHYVRPLCLAQTFESGTSMAIATGWGRVDWGDDHINDKLLKVTLDYFTYKECNDSFAYDINRKLKNGIIDSVQVCAGSHSESKDTCQGDSGGPLQIYHTYACMYEIVGVTSFGKVCGSAGFPGVYTRVFPYLDWIETKVWPNGN